MIERAGAMGSWKAPCIDSVGFFFGWGGILSTCEIWVVCLCI
jgi:hypothetical protein